MGGGDLIGRKAGRRPDMCKGWLRPCLLGAPDQLEGGNSLISRRGGCRGTKSNNKSRGVRMRRQGPSYSEVVHTSLRVQSPHGGGKSPMSRCPEAVDWNIGVCYKGCEPLSQRGVAYIECARTPAALRYRSSMYTKIGRYW